MEDEVKSESKLNRRNFKSSLILGLQVLVLLAIAGFGIWSYTNYINAKKEISRLSSTEGQQQLAKQEADRVVSSLSKLMILPKGEDPTVATITDVDSLKKNQPFFNDAQNGDKLVVYSAAKRAIIYSPSRNVVVNVGSVSLDGGTTASLPSPTP